MTICNVSDLSNVGFVDSGVNVKQPPGEATAKSSNDI